MSSAKEQENEFGRKIPFYQTVDGFKIPGMFPATAFRSALTYKPRPDDLFIVTFPKCGTTWVQHIVACIYKKGKPFESYLEYLVEAPFLEITGAEGAEKMKRPGAIKVHLPFHLTPWSPEAKYIFIARNPKDCCVSFYHHTENIPGYLFEGASFDDFFELFIEGQTDFGDYFDTTLSWYEHRKDPNVLFLTYEELKKDTEANVLRIAEFMGSQYKEALDKDKKLLENVIKHSSFSFMKEHLNKQMAEIQSQPKDIFENNPNLPSGIKEIFVKDTEIYKKEPTEVNFVRKGIVGDWKNYFTLEQNSRLEKKFKEKMGHTELAEIWKDIM